MAITALFRVPGMSSERYDECIRRLEASGEGAPPARRFHVAASSEDGWLVVDVWHSEEELGRFAGVLMPILAELGVTPPRPEVHPVHNVIRGKG